MAKETEEIKLEIDAFKNENGGDYSDYYIGITKHIDQRLVESSEDIFEHLKKGEYTKGNPTYTAECKNRNEAVEIERFFQAKDMLKFNPRSFGVAASKFIYCYKMTEENKKNVLLENSNQGKKKKKFIKGFEDFEDNNKTIDKNK